MLRDPSSCASAFESLVRALLARDVAHRARLLCALNPERDITAGPSRWQHHFSFRILDTFGVDSATAQIS
jgi:hypothetical protein